MPIPKCPNPPFTKDLDNGIKPLKVQIVTPMFGGGVNAREVDPLHPFRETSIRGQLQFWWRATTGAKYECSRDLFNAFSGVWGSTKIASKVSVTVTNVKVGPKTPCAKFNWNKNAKGGQGAWKLDWIPQFNQTALPYALFPFQGELPKGNQNANSEVPPASFVEGSFDLTINCHKSIRESVETAVKAWINFGGLGSRTRRGCGTLYEQDYSFKNEKEIREWIAKNSTDFIREWPTLSKSIFLQKPDVMYSSWNQSIKVFRDFRQLPGFGRNPIQDGKNRPGRSRFPEPDTIRRLTGKHHPDHKPSESMPDGFPRAELGLPIIFQFKGNNADPDDTTLFPDIDKAERFASPLILKAIACGDARGFPAIVLMNGKRVKHCRLELRNKQVVTRSKNIPIQHKNFEKIAPSPMNGYSSAISAFLAYAKTNDFH